MQKQIFIIAITVCLSSLPFRGNCDDMFQPITLNGNGGSAGTAVAANSATDSVLAVAPKVLPTSQASADLIERFKAGFGVAADNPGQWVRIQDPSNIPGWWAQRGLSGQLPWQTGQTSGHSFAGVSEIKELGSGLPNSIDRHASILGAESLDETIQTTLNGSSVIKDVTAAEMSAMTIADTNSGYADGFLLMRFKIDPNLVSNSFYPSTDYPIPAGKLSLNNVVDIAILPPQSSSYGFAREMVNNQIGSAQAYLASMDGHVFPPGAPGKALYDSVKQVMDGRQFAADGTLSNQAAIQSELQSVYDQFGAGAIEIPTTPAGSIAFKSSYGVLNPNVAPIDATVLKATPSISNESALISNIAPVTEADNVAVAIGEPIVVAKSIGKFGGGLAVLGAAVPAAQAVYDFSTDKWANTDVATTDLQNTEIGVAGLYAFIPGGGWIIAPAAFVVQGVSGTAVDAFVVQPNARLNAQLNRQATAQGNASLWNGAWADMLSGNKSIPEGIDYLHTNGLISDQLYQTYMKNYLSAAGLGLVDWTTGQPNDYFISNAQSILVFGPTMYQNLTDINSILGVPDQSMVFQANQTASIETPGTSVVQLWNNPSVADQIYESGMNSFNAMLTSQITTGLDFVPPMDPPNVNTIMYNGAQIPVDFNPNWGFAGANMTISTTDSSAQVPVVDYFPYSNPVGQPASNAFFNPPSYFDLGNLDAQLSSNFGSIDYSGILPDTGAALDSLTSTDGGSIGTPIGDYSTSGGGDVSTDAPIFDGTQVDLSAM